MPTLSSLSSLRLHLGVPSSDTSEDTALTQFLTQAEALIRKYVRQAWSVPAISYTQYLNGRNTDTLILRHRPVTAITSVYLDRGAFFGTGEDAFAAATLLTAGSDYALEPDQSDGTSHSGLLRRLNGVWPPAVQYQRGNLSAAMIDSKGCIKVVYTAGWSAAPSDLELAANLVAANLRGFRLGAPLSSESYDGYSVSFTRGSKAMNPLEPALALLAPYRSMVMGIN